MRTAIETHNLVKQFGTFTAVENLCLQVEQGEIYAFLGLNGAGKTTTIRMLLGMLRPTAGEAYVLGHKIGPGEKKPWASVGYLVETANAYPELTVRQNLEAMRRLHPGIEPKAVDRVIHQLGLTAYAKRRTGTLSLGNAQRLGVAKALLHNPKLLILDEPANGLDPAGIVEMRHLLLQLAHEQGITIFMSSHILGEVSRLAQRIGIIHEGRLVQELDIADLERKRQQQLLIRTHDDQAACTTLHRAGFAAKMANNGAITLQETAALQYPDKIATHLVHAGYAPTMLVTEQEDLEHYFLRLIGQNGKSAS